MYNFEQTKENVEKMKSFVRGGVMHLNNEMYPNMETLLFAKEYAKDELEKYGYKVVEHSRMDRYGRFEIVLNAFVKDDEGGEE